MLLCVWSPNTGDRSSSGIDNDWSKTTDSLDLRKEACTWRIFWFFSSWAVLRKRISRTEKSCDLAELVDGSGAVTKMCQLWMPLSPHRCCIQARLRSNSHQVGCAFAHRLLRVSSIRDIVTLHGVARGLLSPVAVEVVACPRQPTLHHGCDKPHPVRSRSV